MSSDGVEASGPLSRWVIEEPLEEARDFLGATRAWQDEMNFVWEESAVFPDSVDLDTACREGECCHNLNPRQEHRYAAISEELRLLLRHSGLPDDSRLCVELRCGDEVRYALIGDHQWSHKLRCEIFLLERNAGGGHHLFELGFQREADENNQKFGWPRIQGETMFLLSLLDHSSDPWHIYCLRTVPGAH